MSKTQSSWQVAEALKKANLRTTKQRCALAKLLLTGEPRHFIAEEAYKQAQDAGIDVSRSTVYNTLNNLVGAGYLGQLVLDAKKTYFDTETRPHHHYIFEPDGKIQDFFCSDHKIIECLDLPPETHVAELSIIVKLRKKP